MKMKRECATCTHRAIECKAIACKTGVISNFFSPKDTIPEADHYSPDPHVKASLEWDIPEGCKILGESAGWYIGLGANNGAIAWNKFNGKTRNVPFGSFIESINLTPKRKSAEELVELAYSQSHKSSVSVIHGLIQELSKYFDLEKARKV